MYVNQLYLYFEKKKKNSHAVVSHVLIWRIAHVCVSKFILLAHSP